MNVYDDESLKQEVIYLHSLWHQGPPTRNPIHDPVQRSRPNYIPPADFQLLSRYGANPIHPQPPLSNKRSRPGSDREWPVKELPVILHGLARSQAARPLSDSRESEARRESDSERHPPRLPRVFRQESSKSGEESDADDGGGGGGGDERSVSVEAVRGEREAEGEFTRRTLCMEKCGCLVCGGSGEKSVRKFKNCLALVQHSLAIHKTMRNQHRALAQTLGVEAVEGATELPPDLNSFRRNNL
ncbi:hypothetical protein HID58_007936 [Brassica napus]|uniref:Uncharacterized protein n=1 Tax=Brassica napus TaxID=3708 RepID=A0ABQ7XJX4_BRANA|nr:hypothetical protein HID58_007936 [Brassica napus]